MHSNNSYVIKLAKFIKCSKGGFDLRWYSIAHDQYSLHRLYYGYVLLYVHDRLIICMFKQIRVSHLGYIISDSDKCAPLTSY